MDDLLKKCESRHKRLIVSGVAVSATTVRTVAVAVAVAVAGGGKDRFTAQQGGRLAVAERQ